MPTRKSQYIDNLLARIDQLPVGSPEELARVLPLYIKATNDNGVVRNVSFAYIDGYDGRKVYRRFTRQFDLIHSVFQRSGLGTRDIRTVFKRVALRELHFPTTVKGMDILKGMVYEETQKWLTARKLAERREKLVSQFKKAVKKYLGMTYELGFNEPSACAKSLAETHKIDKYIMAGDFAVMLLPFMPELEDAIRRSYEHYEMQDAWQNLKGRYFDHKSEWYAVATEIKSTFNRTVSNFTRYFDDLYTNTYYKLMLSRGEQRG